MTSNDLRWLAALLLLAWGPVQGAVPAGVRMEPVKAVPVAADLKQGKALYERYCNQCHGNEGKGDGPAADFVYPRPRDFTLALYKVRTTLSGQIPTDHDLFKVISAGLPGTSMPAWKKYISESDRWQLVHYVKTFDSLGIFKDEPAKEQVAVSEAPKVTPELIAKGKEVYRAKKCWQCHGQYGRGDGTSAEGLKDDWRFPIRPVNFTKGWRYRAGDRVEDIFRTFTTGFNGTPMPSFVDAIPSAEDRWALAAFVKSLTRPPKNGQVLKARRIAGEIPGDPYARAWEEAEYLDFPLAGQIILDPRWFKPAHDVITARAIYNDRELAILLEWDDGTYNKGEGGKPADQVALQLPAAKITGDEKPYFVLGDRRHGVDYWRWNAGQGLARFTAAGHDRVTPREAGNVTAQGGYKDGQYRVILRRPLTPSGDNEAAFEPGRFVPVAFHLWDGHQGEEGLKMAISSWYYLLLEPETPLTVYLWPMGLGFVALGGEFWLLRRLRRRRNEEVKP
ncbi:MAG: c-type cytochrome [Betaproteobacteria bacterium]|nr:c-type cytochrome [Betaproteobacteria bacterium]